MYKRDGKVLLVAMPLHDTLHSSLSLSILKQCIINSGYQCDVRYASLEFSKLIGHNLYNSLVKGKSPFLSDLIFANALNDNLNNIEGSPEIQLLSEKASFFIKKIAKAIFDEHYDVIGFNTNYHTVPSLALAKQLKQMDPSLSVLFGGANCEGEMGIALHKYFSFIDYVCIGEGEVFIVHLLNYLFKQQGHLNEIKGIAYRNNSNEQFVNSNSEIVDVNTVPCANFSDWFAQLTKFSTGVKQTDIILPIESSRGCWHAEKQKCLFCGLCGNKFYYRVKDASKVQDEIEQYSDQYGINRFFAMDLVFPNLYFKDFLPYQNNKYGYGYEIRADISKSKLRELKQANVFFVLSGIESLDTEMLTLLRKGTKAYQNIRLLKWAFMYGVNIEWFILCACPGENSQMYIRSKERISYLSHLPPPKSFDDIELHRFSPLYEERKSLGLKNVRPNHAYSKFYNLPDEQLNELAYYFEYDYEPPKEVDDLRKAVQEWKDNYSSEIFFSIEFNNCLYFYDSRAIAKQEIFFITRDVKAIYLLCDSGATQTQLIEKSCLDMPNLQQILQTLLSKNLIMEIDNLYLSLAVEMDPTLIKIEDITLAMHFYAQIYKTWAQEMQKFII